MEGMTDAFFRECFISGLKDEICAQVIMAHPQTWLEATKCAKEAQQVILAQSRKPTFVPHPKPNTPAPQATPLKVHKLTWEEMVECQLKGLFYNCDDKYFPGHKCKEQKLFMAISRMFLMKMLRFHLKQCYPQPMILHHPLILLKLNH
jgi:hypothetical protein